MDAGFGLVEFGDPWATGRGRTFFGSGRVLANTAWMPWIFMGLCGRTMGLARHPRSSPLHQGAAVADLTCRPVLLAALSSQHANACTGPSSRRCRTNGGLTYLTPVRNQRGRAAAQEIVQWLVASRNWTCTAADALVAKGERPTVERVRAHLDTAPRTRQPACWRRCGKSSDVRYTLRVQA